MKPSPSTCLHKASTLASIDLAKTLLVPPQFLCILLKMGTKTGCSILYASTVLSIVHQDAVCLVHMVLHVASYSV